MTLVPASSRSIGLPIGLPGATAAVRFVGGTTTGIPTTGTFAVGDFVIAETEGRVYVCTVAGTPGTWADAGQDPLQAGFGLKAWNFNPYGVASNAALVSQTIYALAVPTTAGQTYTGVRLWVQTVGTSTAPTGFFAGLASIGTTGATGTMLAQTANKNADTQLTTGGIANFGFTGSYVETVTGLRAIVLLQNGAFAGTNVKFYTSSATLSTVSGQQNTSYQAGTAQTALPANTAALPSAFASGSQIEVWAALY